MKNKSLATKGLSISQAQSISNLCFQRAREIAAELSKVNNSSKTIFIDGLEFTKQQPNPIPENVISLLELKAKLHATQAFLMENIKAKDQLIKSIKFEELDLSEFSSLNPRPVMETYSEKLPELVDEILGWGQLSETEYNEYLEAEAYASHIGQFIHKDGKLDILRNELSSMDSLEFMEIETGKKTPVRVSSHHTPEQLYNIHEQLATLHRKYEQKVNYFKAKVKNLVTMENARISKEKQIISSRIESKNKELKEKYESEMNEYSNKISNEIFKFEEAKYDRIKEASELKINVDSRFQDVVDMFLNKIE
jgi:hypothetical protein